MTTAQMKFSPLPILAIASLSTALSSASQGTAFTHLNRSSPERNPISGLGIEKVRILSSSESNVLLAKKIPAEGLTHNEQTWLSVGMSGQMPVNRVR